MEYYALIMGAGPPLCYDAAGRAAAAAAAKVA